MGIFDFFQRKQQNNDIPDKVSMPKVDNKTLLNAIQKEIYTYLKPLGFKRKGRTFNRQTEVGIYQVINVQSGKYDFGDKYVIPGSREDLYGKFTINLGVMVTELYELDHYHSRKDVYQDYDCSIRTRLCNLMFKQDHWWSISIDVQDVSSQVISGLEKDGIPWLDQFDNREKICEIWGVIEGSSVRAKLDVAIIILQKDKMEGKRLIQEYYDNIEIKNGHKEYVKDLANELGVTING